MESLIGYGSEDEEEPTYRKRTIQRQPDVNYDEVQMELSEDSSNSPKSNSYQLQSKSKDSYLYARDKDKEKSRRGSDDYKSKYDDKYSPKYEKSRNDYKSRDKYKNDDDRSDRHRVEKSRDYKRERSYDDKDKRRDEKSREYRSNRDSREREDRYKESKNYDSRDGKRYSHEKDRDRNYESRDSSSRGSKHYSSQDRSNSRDGGRNESRTRKPSSPSRHRSRSPVRADNRSKRSNSREMGRPNFSSKYDRSVNKMDRLEKLGIELGTPIEHASTSGRPQIGETNVEKNRFYMPGITGRFTEQIQRRKMLWQKKDAPAVVTPTQKPPVGQPGKVWQNTTFAQDTDGKVANKFKRLMGIKGSGGEPIKPATESLKKQEEMFSSMEAQYEVARTVTHTMRGVGLGFGSFQR